MSTDELRRELDRISASAPEVPVAHDTWARARRSVARERLAVGGAALAVVAAVAAGATWLPDRLDPPVADADVLGVPDHLYSVPERMSDRDNDGAWMRDEVTDDPTVVGTGAAAWVTHQGLPVVVGAADGVYHLLDLPDFAGNNQFFALGQGNPVVALSPDGRRVAYGYAVFGADSDTEPIPSGVRVLDLTTGELREIPVPGDEGTAVSRIEWSPDGSWLAFTGRQQGIWTSESMGNPAGDTGGAVIGRVPPGGTVPEVRAIGGDQVGLAVDDRGTLTWFSGRVHTWDEQDVTVGSGQDPVLERTLGSTLDGSAVRLDGDDDGATGAVELVPTSGGPTEAVVIDNALRPSLSLATTLMSTDRPSVERPEPDWPWTEERWSVTIGLGVAAALAAMLGLRWLWRRTYPRWVAR